MAFRPKIDHNQRNQDVMRKGDIVEWDRPNDTSCGGGHPSTKIDSNYCLPPKGFEWRSLGGRASNANQGT